MIKDILEHLEAAGEAMYERMAQPDGKLKCDCGRIFDPNIEGGPVSPNPFAMPICGECLSSFLREEPK